MQIVVLGAAGSLGRAASRAVAALEEIDGVTLADIDVSAINALAGELGPTAEAVELDATDGDRLTELLAAHGAVINAIGPYDRFSAPVLDAAIATGTAYVDACDDPSATLALLGRSADAAAVGVRAVIGAGLSPGLSNIVAVVAARELDEVVTLHTGWSVDAGEGGFRSAEDLTIGPDGRPSTALVTWLDRVRADLAFQHDGHLLTVSTMEPTHLYFPGLGAGTAWTSGHPEELTLPASLAVQGRCENLMVMRRNTAAYLNELRSDIAAGRIDATDAPALVVERPFARRLQAVIQGLRTPGPGALPAFFAVAEGSRGGGSGMRVGARLTSMPPGLDNSAGVTLALTAALIATGHGSPGVLAPEAAIEPEVLLERLVPWCHPEPASLDQLVDVTIEQI